MSTATAQNDGEIAIVEIFEADGTRPINFPGHGGCSGVESHFFVGDEMNIMRKNNGNVFKFETDRLA